MGLARQVVGCLGFSVLSRNATAIVRQFRPVTAARRCRFGTQTSEAEKDPAPLFFDDEVQKLLKTLTRPDPKKVFRVRMDGHPIKDPQYKFMTTEELEAAVKKAEEEMHERLQMPPVVKERDEINQVLSKDPALQGCDESKYVFTDITFGVGNVDRLIVVRDPDGTLRKADWSERFRMNQIYFPVEGREVFTPKMFQDEHLKKILDRKDYEFILDRACVQFDPDDPEYQRITRVVYDAVNAAGEYNALRSTRHYGPFAFHLAVTRSIDNLLLENIEKEYIEDAVLLIKLLHKIHPTLKSVEFSSSSDVELIEKYAELDSPSRGKLISSLNAYKELVEVRRKVQEGVQKAHGR